MLKSQSMFVFMTSFPPTISSAVFVVFVNRSFSIVSHSSNGEGTSTKKTSKSQVQG